jgi:hypothetical protein
MTNTVRQKYIYRRIPAVDKIGPGINRLRVGDEIKFGTGRDGSKLGGGSLPLLCNLRLAVTRVLMMSGAVNAEAIAQLTEDADDSDFSFASSDFFNVLTAKLALKNIPCVQ